MSQSTMKNYRVLQEGLIVNGKAYPVGAVLSEEVLEGHIDILLGRKVWKYPGRGVSFKQRDEKTGEVVEIKNEQLIDPKSVYIELVVPPPVPTPPAPTPAKK